MSQQLGVCRLCRNAGHLRDSHFMPAALYPKGTTKKPKKITFATRTTSGVDPTEVKDHLLCGRCESRFNRLGESEVLRLVAAKETSEESPLLAKLRSAKPLRCEPEWAVYSGPSVGVDTDRFAYFALSLVWRASVHDWTLPDGTLSTRYDLGRHEEPIRRFLLETAPFPSEVAVVMTVCTNSDARSVWVAPTQTDQPRRDCSTYHIQMLGLVLVVWLGTGIPEPTKEYCCRSAPEKPIVAIDCSKVLVLGIQGLKQF
jgi:hypothetical protein